MRWREVDSTNLKSVSYDRKSRQLFIEFQSGPVYRYEKVSYYRYRKLLHADSHGRYFNTNIRMKYVYERMMENGKEYH
jgi:hypothetical protein